MSEIKHAGLGTVVLLAVLAIAYQAFDRSRRYSAKGSREVLAEAPDRYFLYLRSFVDDELSIEGPVYSVQTMPQKRGSNRCKIGSPRVRTSDPRINSPWRVAPSGARR